MTDSRGLSDKFPPVKEPNASVKVTVNRTAEALETVVPSELTAGNPEVLAFEWN